MTTATPTIPPPGPENLAGSLKRNIESLQERRRQEAAHATRQERLAEAITSFAGSMAFVYLHLTIYAVWIALNLGFIPGLPKFDPSFVILATEASVEAIFLSTFVLISQNRTAAASDKRADLDLHINLLTEHELTKLSCCGAGDRSPPGRASSGTRRTSRRSRRMSHPRPCSMNSTPKRKRLPIDAMDADSPSVRVV